MHEVLTRINCPHCAGEYEVASPIPVDVGTVELLAMQLHAQWAEVKPDWYRTTRKRRSEYRALAHKMLEEAGEDFHGRTSCP